MKDKCCKSYKKKGKACKSCPLIGCVSEEKLEKLARKIKKKKARERFVERYFEAVA